jgi:succinate-acetate transporter protein
MKGCQRADLRAAPTAAVSVIARAAYWVVWMAVLSDVAMGAMTARPSGSETADDSGQRMAAHLAVWTAFGWECLTGSWMEPRRAALKVS